LRTGTVRALEDTVVLVIQAEDFQRICTAMPMLDDYFKDHISSEYPAKPPLPTISPKVSDEGATT
jgi:NADH:ubiquinone reductase (H+-translocating)